MVETQEGDGQQISPTSSSNIDKRADALRVVTGDTGVIEQNIGDYTDKLTVTNRELPSESITQSSEEGAPQTLSTVAKENIEKRASALKAVTSDGAAIQRNVEEYKQRQLSSL